MKELKIHVPEAQHNEAQIALKVLIHTLTESHFAVTCPYCLSLVAVPFSSTGRCSHEEGRCGGCGRVIQVLNWYETGYGIRVKGSDDNSEASRFLRGEP